MSASRFDGRVFAEIAPPLASERAEYYAASHSLELLEAAFVDFTYERHFHDTFAIGVTLRGVQRFWCRGTTYNSVRGDILVIPPGEPHDGESGGAGGYAYRMFYVAESALLDIVTDASEHPAVGIHLRQTSVLREPSLARRLEMSWRAMRADATSLAAEESFRRAFLSLVVREPWPGLVSRGLDVPAIRRVRDYLRDHVAERVTMQELASIASMTRFRLTRQFQKMFGLPLHAYHLQLRLHEAKRRLQAGAPIAAVAFDLGFVDQSHLHRRFKGAFGVTPGEWRNAVIK